MNCSTCRGSFSGSFDGRLSGDVRQDFIRHVQACGVCGPEYALYQRVFSAVRGLPDGAAPQFRAPAEVPGALYAAQPFGARPRFARVAAAILILIGLASTHVLVFQWSRDHAPGTEPRAGGPAIAAAAFSSPLPAALRDHVDATDLFIRTAANLPDDASARDVARAHWMASDLVRRTTDLRAQTLSPEVPEEHRALIGQYLADAAEDFVPRMRGLIEPEGEFLAPISQIRMTAVQNRIVQHQDIPQMKVLVAALPRGTSFARAFVVLPGAGLAPDGRVFLESMQARLAGNMSAALAGCQRFEGEFSKSPLRATALRLMADTYANAGRYSEAMAIAGRATCQCPGAPQPVMNAAAYLVEFGPRGFDFRAPTIDHIELRAPAIEHVFKGTPGELLKGMPGVDHMFKGIIQISGSSGARVWIMKSEAVPPTRLTELLSDEPESRPVRNPK